MSTDQPSADATAEQPQQPDKATRWRASTLDLLGPYAVRVATSVGLADLIAAGHTSADDLAREAGTAPGATARLLRYLAARGVFRERTPRALRPPPSCCAATTPGACTSTWTPREPRGAWSGRTRT
ncbi:methyltransferase family protein [Streptomyces sp. NBC_00525]|uniref:methyltransferase family protein n=1 Tax=Streptomyces sp. NBC_00525 TaxID=2903660 RepID=UPI002E80B0A7|nr:hypothetical protein [Streptomyces sp. NBC_00525]WUC96418.1 hypothetical protein OG710_23690 [Streptomyces sp. NBC_00525]